MLLILHVILLLNKKYCHIFCSKSSVDYLLKTYFAKKILLKMLYSLHNFDLYIHNSSYNKLHPKGENSSIFIAFAIGYQK